MAISAKNNVRTDLSAPVARTSKTSMKVVEIAISQLVPNPAQARRTFDPVKMAELQASITTTGLQNPILISKNEDADEDRYFIIAGERRWRACSALKMLRVPTIIVDAANAEEIALIDNIQRVDLNILELADGYRHIMEAKGYTQADLEKIVGKSQGEISSILGASRLIDEIKAEYPNHAANIANRTIIEIARCDPDTQRQLWEMAKTGTGLIAIKDAAQAARAGRPTKPALETPAPTRIVATIAKATKHIGAIHKLRAEITADDRAALEALHSQLGAILAG